MTADKIALFAAFFFYKQTHTDKIKHISKSILSGKTPVKGRMCPAVLWLSWLFLYEKLLHFKNDCYNCLSDKPAGLWEVNQQQVGTGQKKLAKYTPNVKDRSEATLQKWLAGSCIFVKHFKTVSTLSLTLNAQRGRTKRSHERKPQTALFHFNLRLDAWTAGDVI